MVFRSQQLLPSPSILCVAVLVGFTVVISFLPGGAKLALHTRGPLHLWAHGYLFAGISALVGNCAEGKTRAWRGVMAVLLLAFLIEFGQARGSFQDLEWIDLTADGAGVGLAWLWRVCIRWRRANRLPAMTAQQQSA